MKRGKYLRLMGMSALTLACCARPALAETGQEAWLRYAPLDAEARQKYVALPAVSVTLSDAPMLKTAQAELLSGFKGMMGRTLREEKALPTKEGAIVLGTVEAIQKIVPGFGEKKALPQEGAAVQRVLPRLGEKDPPGEEEYWLKTQKVGGFRCLIIAGMTERSVLYGVFGLLSKIARSESVASLDEVQRPAARLRWVDQWDNLDGSIERGYGGRSIFFDGGKVRADLTRVREYARLLASVGIDGCAINNVNADSRLLTKEYLPDVARIADVFREWGIQIALSIDLSSPQKIGGLDTFDPLSPVLREWWREKADEIYALIPDFGGFVVKADSEGRPGPSSYGRTPADAANVLARALKPHGGIVFYRAFVYDHHLNWQDQKADRARAAYDIFQPLDGKFDDNVVVQIKHGPIDFQVREPVSPLFAGLQRTNTAIELQITQEYFGQGWHLVFLPSMWKEALDFDMGLMKKAPSRVKNIVSAETFGRTTTGFVGVANVGMDPTWLGHVLSQANLYGFARLAWDPDLNAKAIAEEWTRLTFGNHPAVVATVVDMQDRSWRVYEEYTGPLGLQTLTDIVGKHFGPGVEASERNGWGQWHRADHEGVGMDRSVATGTGFAGQYPELVAKMYEKAATTPDDLLLFFHHVPYTYKLKSGKTVIQYIYDSHYEGAESAALYVAQWGALKGLIDEQRYDAVLARLEYQAGHAIVWRDAVCNWFFRASGIEDQYHRVGKYPGRIEAEAMELQGYAPVDVVPWENASGGKAIECLQVQGCTAAFKFTRDAGWYELDVEYFDQNNGESKFRVMVGDQVVDEWTADELLPATKIGGDSSTRRRIPGLALRPGDEIRILGIPDKEEHAALDYVEISGRTLPGH
jgi:alpha-glucuronidase